MSANFEQNYQSIFQPPFTVLDKNLTFRSTLLNGALNFIIVEDGKIISFEFNK